MPKVSVALYSKASLHALNNEVYVIVGDLELRNNPITSSMNPEKHIDFEPAIKRLWRLCLLSVNCLHIDFT